MRGAERRQALVRNAAPVASLAVRPVSGSPETPAGSPTGAPLGALLRLSAEAFRPLPQLRSALACPGEHVRAVSELLAQGSIVPPGRVPKPPGSPADNRDPQAPRKLAWHARPTCSGTAWLFSARASRPLHQAASPVDAPRRARREENRTKQEQAQGLFSGRRLQGGQKAR